MTRRSWSSSCWAYLVTTAMAFPTLFQSSSSGGLGKTTLAQVAFNAVKDHFDEMIWICVSDNGGTLNVKDIASSIVKVAGGSSFDWSTMYMVEKAIKRKLEGCKYLLVLDDVWNDDQERWRRLRGLLSSGARCSKVIVTTTRSARTAFIVSTAPLMLLKGLSEGDCWMIFQSRAFGIGSAVRTHAFEAIGKEIVKKCRGLPMAAQALGGSRRFKREEREWLAVRDSELWELAV